MGVDVGKYTGAEVPLGMRWARLIICCWLSSSQIVRIGAPSTCLSSDADTDQCQDEAACASSTLAYHTFAMSHCRHAGTTPWTAGSQRTGDATTTGDTRLRVTENPATENSERLTTCPAGLQEQIDTLYAHCGGLTLTTQRDIDWDTQVGPTVKQAVEACGCAGSLLQGGQPLLAPLVCTAAVVTSALLA